MKAKKIFRRLLRCVFELADLPLCHYDLTTDTLEIQFAEMEKELKRSSSCNLWIVGSSFDREVR